VSYCSKARGYVVFELRGRDTVDGTDGHLVYYRSHIHLTKLAPGVNTSPPP